MTIPGRSPQCLLCDGPANYDPPIRHSHVVHCRRCGNYEISFQAEQSLNPGDRWLFSAYCRRHPKGTTPFIKTPNIKDIKSSIPQYSPPEQLDNLLDLMCRMSPSEFGMASSLDPENDYPLLIMRGPGEVRSYMAELQRRGYISTVENKVVLIDGWKRLEEIARSARQSTRTFVAMWFDKSMDDLFEKAIKPAVTEAGYEPLRIDKFEHVNRIDDEIVGQIRRSRFMVADFSGQRHGVYFEAGMMLGLGRNVFWMCPKGELDENKVHFDVRQYNFIAYESVEDARIRLYHRILAKEGEGPVRPGKQ